MFTRLTDEELNTLINKLGNSYSRRIIRSNSVADYDFASEIYALVEDAMNVRTTRIRQFAADVESEGVWV